MLTNFQFFLNKLPNAPFDCELHFTLKHSTCTKIYS